MSIENKIQLITYPDSLGANLPELHYVLRKYFLKAVRGVHLLPFYPSSSDRGFAPKTYDEVDPAFGTWEDVEKSAGTLTWSSISWSTISPGSRCFSRIISPREPTVNTRICS